MTDAEFFVVVNDEEQYSIWPAGQPIPGGWKSTGKPGPRAAALAYIAEVWTDLRPASTREQPADVR